MFNTGIGSFLRLKRSSGTEVQHNFKISTCDPLKYIVDNPNLFVFICIGNSIYRIQWVGIAKQVKFLMQN